MRRKIITITLFYLVLCFTSSYAQPRFSKVNGVLEASSYSYAYLFLSDRNLTVKKPIVNGRFNFQVNKEKEFEMAILYFGLDSTRTYADIIEKRNAGVFESKIIALDDSITIYVKDNVKDSQVVGGAYTKALYAMNEAIETGNYKGFFEEYSKSPLTLMLLGVIIKVEQRTHRKTFINYQEVFDKLPLDLQNSKKGIEVKELLKDKS